MEPLVFAAWIITLDHVVRQFLLADTVPDRFFGIRVDTIVVGLTI